MKRHVLVVDDEEAIRLTQSAILELHGFRVVTASCAQAAEKALCGESFDVVITDLKMETERAGFDVAACAAVQNPRPVTIVISAYPKLAINWEHRGVDAFFEKPTTTAELIHAIDDLLARRDRTAAA
jgi:DNA-binding NtrC family response regulator